MRGIIGQYNKSGMVGMLLNVMPCQVQKDYNPPRTKIRENYGSVWTYLSFQFQMGKQEREICEFDIKNFFLIVNDDIDFLGAWSENWCEKSWHFLVWNRFRI